ncbi:hypothetical protein [Kitasatospora sp. NPDC091276]|uniref:hypothetical protein n=1 Tax=Kitasatospora sp. NPDC091276 TaxID=3155300 RepID=UPI00343712A3
MKDLLEAAHRSGRFAGTETVEVAGDPELVDVHLETLTGNLYLVMLPPRLDVARVLFEDYVFDDVPAHRILDFVDVLERGEVRFSFAWFGRELVLRVPLPEGTWVSQRRFRDDLSDWEKGVFERR